MEDGFGISVLPYCLIEEYLKEGRLAKIKVEDLCLERNLNLVYHPHKVWNDPLRDFMDIVRWYGHDEIRTMETTDMDSLLPSIKKNRLPEVETLSFSML